MVTLNARASVMVATTGTSWNNPANAVDGAFGVNSATYAVFTSTAANAVGTIDVGCGTYLGTAIPANASAIDVLLTMRHLESNTTNIASVVAQAYDGATPIGTAKTFTKATSARNDTHTITPTLAQIQSPNFKVRITATRYNGTSAGTFSLDFVDLAITYTAPLPKTETLVDTFDTTVDKAGKWSASSAAVVWDPSGRAKIPNTTSYYGLGTDGAGTFDFTGSSVYAKVDPPPVGAGSLSRETLMHITAGGSSNDRLTLLVSGTSISARRTLAGAVNGEGPWFTYNPVAHAWWRIRESAGITYFDTSPDGTTWTNFWSVANGFNVTQVWVSFSSGYWGTEAPSDAFIDNVNTVPAVGGATGRPKAYNGSAFVSKPGKVWTGLAWVEKPWKVWTGSAWKALT